MTWRKELDPRMAGLGPIDLPALRQRMQPVFADATDGRTAYLFGSQARGDAGAGSDIDIAVGFDGEPSEREVVEATTRLYARIAEALGRTDIDLVALNGADPELCNDAVRCGVPLFERDPDSVAYDRCCALHAWMDVRELRERETERVLEPWRQPRA